MAGSNFSSSSALRRAFKAWGSVEVSHSVPGMIHSWPSLSIPKPREESELSQTPEGKMVELNGIEPSTS